MFMSSIVISSVGEIGVALNKFVREVRLESELWKNQCEIYKCTFPKTIPETIEPFQANPVHLINLSRKFETITERTYELGFCS
jgi:hypothetical protein